MGPRGPSTQWMTSFITSTALPRQRGISRSHRLPRTESSFHIHQSSIPEVHMPPQRTDPAPNRTLDLRDLHRQSYRSVLDSMERLLRRERWAYLHPSKRWEYPWALERAQLFPGARVLDAGCGSSIFPIYLAAQGYAVSATDINLPREPMRSGACAVHYVEADLGALPVRAESFDAVFCVSVLEHLPRTAMLHALGELQRVLRPGGRCLVTTDFYEDADEPLRYDGPGEPFAVDWNVFDEHRLRVLIDGARGLRLEGALDLQVNWQETRARMRQFHGYPYTSVGIGFTKP
ncbi:MAG: methyltransferase domain-containing protein [Chitinivibrionales bacterium]|nr:methyltransferase domain-containing protein [Chitinivibrionales bacterium]